MKKSVFLSAAVALAFGAQSQTLTVIYQYQRPDCEKNTRPSDEMGRRASGKNLCGTRKIWEYKLVNSRGKSRFSAIKDAAASDSAGGDPWVKRVHKRLEEVAVYKDFAKRTYEYRVSLGLQSVVVTDSLKKTDWIIDAEKKHIGKYEVTRAHRPDDWNPKDTVVAWFAAGIPTFDGPLNCWGLPGLILELQSPRGHLIAREIRFEKKSASIKPLDERGLRVITEKKFLSAVKNQRH